MLIVILALPSVDVDHNSQPVPQTTARNTASQSHSKNRTVTGCVMACPQTHSSNGMCNIDSHLSMINWIYKKKKKKKWNKLKLRSFWQDSSQKISGIWMNRHYLHSLHQITVFLRSRWVASEPTNSKSPLHLPATLMGLRKRTSSSLGSWRSLNALVNKAQLHMGFIIMPIRQLGWQGCFLKSEFINLSVPITRWLTL